MTTDQRHMLSRLDVAPWLDRGAAPTRDVAAVRELIALGLARDEGGMARITAAGRELCPRPIDPETWYAGDRRGCGCGRGEGG